MLDVAGTVLGLGVVLGTLVALDPRVGDQFSQTFQPGPAAKLMSWGDRLIDLLRVLADVAREQGADNSAMLVLLLIGAVLTVFMVRT
jgi:hypothetical protein